MKNNNKFTNRVKNILKTPEFYLFTGAAVLATWGICNKKGKTTNRDSLVNVQKNLILDNDIECGGDPLLSEAIGCADDILKNSKDVLSRYPDNPYLDDIRHSLGLPCLFI